MSFLKNLFGGKEKVMEYNDFLVECEVARRTQNAAKLKQLLGSKVRCGFCKTAVDAVKAVQEGGSLLVCPNCGKKWMQR